MDCESALQYGIIWTLTQRKRSMDLANNRFQNIIIGREEAWHNNHGMGLEWLTNEIRRLNYAKPTPDNKSYCLFLARELDTLHECIEDSVERKSFNKTCAGAFWQPNEIR